MKYLIKNRKEFAISVGFFVMTVLNLIRAIRSREVAEEVVVAAVYALFGVLAWFYNMPTSEENCCHTGQMRQEKAEKSGRSSGEQFLDSAEENDDFDEEEEEEGEQ